LKAEEKTVLQVKWSDEATLDLVEVVDYVEQRDYAASARLHDEIVQAAERLSDVPYLYRIGKVHGTRELVVRPNYLIVYQVGLDFVAILRILHARQKYP
jgi:toxin ParE1/3/4